MTLLDIQTSVLDLLPKDVREEDTPPPNAPFFTLMRIKQQHTVTMGRMSQ